MRKLGILCLAVVLCLATLGVGFALWSETLYVDAEVNTGDLDVCFGSAVSLDPGTEIDRDKDKHVGCTEVYSYDEFGNLIPFVPCSDRIAIIITKAYPCYSGGVDLTIDNIGTIPVDGNPGIEIDNPNPDIVQVQVLGNPYDEFIIKLPQIDPGDFYSLQIYLHLGQSSEQCATYMLTVTIPLHQWNEDILTPD